MKIQGILVLVMLAGGIQAALAQTSSGSAGADLTYSQRISLQGKSLVQQRLTHLGYPTGGTNGIWGPESAAALNKFQQTHKLQVTGELNQATVKTLNINPDRLLGFRSAGNTRTGHTSGNSD